MERIENPMISYRPEEEDPLCENCHCHNPTNDVEIPMDEGDMTVYYCDECYNELFED